VSREALNLTVIGDRACSTTRVYLHHLRKAGLRPRRLWLVDFSPAPRWIGAAGRVLGAERANRLRAFERRPPAAPAPEFGALCEALQRSAGFDVVDLFSEIDGHAFADEVKSLVAVDYDDPALEAQIVRHADTAFLYTNGGRVPARVLDHPEVRFFHVHPGMVPEVRGSDCLLWSALDRRRVGVSCFYMSPGIDEGDLLGQREFPLPDVSPLRPVLTPDREDMAYRALLFAVDPHYRARVFTDVLEAASGGDLRKCAAIPQTSPRRPPYLWMHPALRRHAMRGLAA